ACWETPDDIRAIAFGTDEKSCFSLDRGGSYSTWDTATATLKTHPVSSGDRVAIGSSIVVTGQVDGTIKRWALPSFEPIEPPLQFSGRIFDLEVSQDGT